jgi:uncharacterized protein (UPF0335 family)
LVVICKHKIDLATNGTIISDALKSIQSKMDNLNGEQKRLLQDIKEDFNSLPEPEEEETTNGVF